MSLTYGVVDTETTGFDHEADRLVEIACVREDGSFSTTLVCPGERRISFGAMATHHITPDMVADAPGAVDALVDVGLGPASVPCTDCNGLGLVEHGDGVDCDGRGFVQNNPDDSAPNVLVFHNAEFDRGFLPEWLRELPYICTWRCALHLFPQAESHSNGSLWYELGLNRELPPEAGSAPHRALFDALMTRDILEWMICHVNFNKDGEHMQGPVNELRDAAIRRLIELTTSPVLLTTCKFGKHRGERWEDIPSRDLEWVLSKDFDEDTKHTCRHWLRERGRMR